MTLSNPMGLLGDGDRTHRRQPSSDATQFKALTQMDAVHRLEHELQKLLETAKPEEKPLIQKEYEGFSKIFTRFLSESSSAISWERIERVSEETIIDYGSLHSPDSSKIRDMLNKVIVVKLNGGLGTSMGCKGPKSVIPVRSELTFLDLTVQQIEFLNKTYGANVPLVLMNSFNTDDDTEKVLRKYKNLNVTIKSFMQSRYPRINKESLMPVAKTCNTDDNQEAWYPPGHGDFYESFYNSGLLSEFLAEGREFCFISNIDNLGATVDLNIMNFFCQSEDPNAPEFLMELTDKTRADVKAGILNAEIIVNHKSLAHGMNVIQLETAVGSAMKCFEKGLGVNVPRSRFLPVKKSQDLLLVMSNLYSLRNGSLAMSPLRMFPGTPLIKLGTSFDNVREFLRRFETIPDVLELDHLTVSGDVNFGRHVHLKGLIFLQDDVRGPCLYSHRSERGRGVPKVVANVASMLGGWKPVPQLRISDQLSKYLNPLCETVEFAYGYIIGPQSSRCNDKALLASFGIHGKRLFRQDYVEFSLREVMKYSRCRDHVIIDSDSNCETMSRVYIGGLHGKTRERDVEKFFHKYGRLREILLKNGYGFVEFDEKRDAEDACHDLDGKELLGERLRVEMARGGRKRGTFRGGRSFGGGGGRGGRDSNNSRRNDRFGPSTRTDYRLYIDNLSSNTSWQDLKDIMRKGGEVTYADKQGSREGVVEFASKSDMKNALKLCDGMDVDGRRIRVTEGGGSRRSRSRSDSRSRSPSHSRSSSPEASKKKNDSSPSRERESRSRSSERERGVTPGGGKAFAGFILLDFLAPGKLGKMADLAARSPDYVALLTSLVLMGSSAVFLQACGSVPGDEDFHLEVRSFANVWFGSCAIAGFCNSLAFGVKSLPGPMRYFFGLIAYHCGSIGFPCFAAEICRMYKLMMAHKAMLMMIPFLIIGYWSPKYFYKVTYCSLLFVGIIIHLIGMIGLARGNEPLLVGTVALALGLTIIGRDGALRTPFLVTDRGFYYPCLVFANYLFLNAVMNGKMPFELPGGIGRRRHHDDDDYY
ncbi:unnamed protein product [Notodromas monacha]|uniref:UTP--glucose-1-phosphate uridylyltransferase n=1 Tax=Notodromas monacha TaxID=399045 RepID=A0A7R9BP59_9CRUS|nr:unnamed protein product [Notodromas monacha]CAG0919125.1 unnamed protein product [Notodromas monacha]